MSQELIRGLRVLLESGEECDDAIRLVASALKRAGVVAKITEEDDEPDDCGSDRGSLWVVSRRELRIGGEPVAEWTRCAVGSWGEMGRQCSEDEWRVTEDREGGDVLPEMVASVLEIFGLEDWLPDVPEPQKANEKYAEDASGEYAVYWETVGDDARVVARYAELDEAGEVCAQRNREFAASHPGGNYLCGYGVRRLVDGEWERVEDD